MRKIAERYIDQMEQGKPVNKAAVVNKIKFFHQKFSVLLILGILSVTLYIGLYEYNADIVALTKSIYLGEKGLFFVPILFALLFSFIHGAFTSKFWDVVGVKAKS